MRSLAATYDKNSAGLLRQNLLFLGKYAVRILANQNITKSHDARAVPECSNLYDLGVETMANNPTRFQTGRDYEIALIGQNPVKVQGRCCSLELA